MSFQTRSRGVFFELGHFHMKNYDLQGEPFACTRWCRILLEFIIASFCHNNGSLLRFACCAAYFIYVSVYARGLICMYAILLPTSLIVNT
jgi:hypothetical protein